MRSKNPELMKNIKEYVEQYFREHRKSPSTTEIAKAVGVARGTAYKYLVAMDEKGIIDYNGKEINTDYLQRFNEGQSKVAVIGSIPCGTPQYEEENFEEYFTLPTAIFGKGELYILRANGDSMIEAGIDDGDLVVIRKQQTANEGQIIVALVEGQSTLKRYFRDDKRKKIVLHPENKEMDDILVDECFIQGVATQVIKQLH